MTEAATETVAGTASESQGVRRWPAEWEPHRATWLAWPHNESTWPGRLGAVEDAYCEMVRAIAPGETVEILVRDVAMADRVRARLADAGVGVGADKASALGSIDRAAGRKRADDALSQVRFRGVATDDAWIRDHGGIFVFEGSEMLGDSATGTAGATDAPGVTGAETATTGPSNPMGPTRATPRRLMLDFGFDAWGGKYPPWDQDADVARQMAMILRTDRRVIDRVLEGGAIDGDGEGTILTTESCLLNPNRARPGEDRSRSAMEGVLAETLGAKKVLWLGDGIEGDDTDGHVDDLTRFVAPGRVVTVVEGASGDSNYAALRENRRRLDEMVDAAGRKLEVVELPMPPRLSGPWGPLPASYANFYFANHALLVPVFGCDRDREALETLGRLVVDRPVVPIPAQNLVLGLGAVHCLTQQEPAAPRLPTSPRG